MNSQIPKVSVIIPVYNAAKYLHECIDSIIAQTLNDIEIIAIDDGSNDNSRTILDEYAKKDERIKILIQANLGAGVARNNGIKHAKGEYLSFFDSDDFFEADMLEKMYKKAQLYTADIVISSAVGFDDVAQKDIKKGIMLQTKYIKKYACFSYKDIPNEIYKLTAPNVWQYMYKKDFIEKYALQYQSLAAANDAYFSMSALVLADKVTYVDEKFVHYRVNTKTSISYSRGKYFYCIFEALNGVREILKEHKRFSFVEKAFYEKAVSLINYEARFVNDNKELLDYSKRLLPEKYYKKIVNNKSLAETFFSVRNEYVNNQKYKIITVLGLQLKFKKKSFL